MVVLYLDLDCFYVQAELCRRPELRGKPVVIQQVQQKGFLAISYEARAFKINRGDGLGTTAPRSLESCLKRCPDLRIVPVDMPHNRYISAEVEKTLRRISRNIIVERNSIDDFCLDCRQEVELREKDFSKVPHVDNFNLFFIMADGDAAIKSVPIAIPPPKDQWQLPTQAQLLSQRTLIGCYLAREIQLELHSKFGITSSIGISSSRLISRLLVGMNKPFGLTLFPDFENLEILLKSLPVTKVHGLRGLEGAAMTDKLKISLNKDTVPTLFDLQQIPEHDLCSLFGDKTGLFLSKISHGEDYLKIEDKGPPKSILVELSFPSMSQTIEIYRMLRSLVEDLLHRVIENTRRFVRRIPTKITVRWRRGSEHSTGSQIFTAPRSIATVCHEAAEDGECIPMSLKNFQVALEHVMSQAMNILLRALQKYPSFKVTGDRQLNRIGVVASAFISSDSILLHQSLNEPKTRTADVSEFSDIMELEDNERPPASSVPDAHRDAADVDQCPFPQRTGKPTTSAGTCQSAADQQAVDQSSAPPEIDDSAPPEIHDSAVKEDSSTESQKISSSDSENSMLKAGEPTLEQNINIPFTEISHSESDDQNSKSSIECWSPELPMIEPPIVSVPTKVPSARRQTPANLSFNSSVSPVATPASTKRLRQTTLTLRPRKKAKADSHQLTLFALWNKVPTNDHKSSPSPSTA